MKLTGWYSGYQKPVRKGVYQREYSGSDYARYCYWDGTAFGWGYDTAKQCSEWRMRWGYSANQRIRWRGVAK